MVQLIRKWYKWFTRDPIIIHLYYAFGYKDRVYFKGRILQNRLVVSRPTDKAIKSLVKFVRRLMTNEQRFKRFDVYINDQAYKFSTDKEGYFEIDLSNRDENSNQITLRTEYAEDLIREVESVSHHADYGIISDIDDTIMRTGVASKFKWRLLINTLFINPWGRQSFSNTNKLFQQLTVSERCGSNPIFYISNSPWNIYHYIEDYLISNGFPRGPLLLRDINISWFKRQPIHEQNKYKEICKILNICSDISFILIGDSGELDADIYHAIDVEFPGRIKAIYIRNIPKSKRINAIQTLISKMGGKGMLFINSHEILDDIN